MGTRTVPGRDRIRAPEQFHAQCDTSTLGRRRSLALVAYRIQINCRVGAVAASTLDHLRARLGELGESLAAVPESSAFWFSLQESPLYVDVEGWRFFVAVDVQRKRLTVVSVIRRAKGGPTPVRKG